MNGSKIKAALKRSAAATGALATMVAKEKAWASLVEFAREELREALRELGG